MKSLSKDPGPDWCRVGAITGVHGIKGALKFLKECESDKILQPGAKLYRIAVNGMKDTVTVQGFRQSGKFHLLILEGVEDRTQAESLVGSTLYVEQSVLPQLEEGTYYWFELIGLSVFTMDGSYVGKIAEIIPTGANDVYAVRDGGRETLIPAIHSVIQSVDLKSSVMQVDLPEGL